jgi:hypothetical protein
MPESHRDESASAPTIKRLGRGVHWDATAAIVASLVGLLALLVAGYTAYIQRQQVRAQVWPYLLGAGSSGSHSLIWINKGVGPAIIRNVEVMVDGKPQADWPAVFHALHVQSLPFHQSTLNFNVVSAGERLDWLQFQDAADYDRFRLLQSRVHVKVCYCSTLGDCWISDPTTGGNGRSPVAKCPRLPAASQFNE